MKKKLWIAAGAAVAGIVAFVSRRREKIRVEALSARLREPGGADVFGPSSVRDLPDPAARYLTHAVAPNAPIARFVEFAMTGRIRLKPGGSWSEFSSTTILHATRGFIWKAAMKRPPMRGFDRYVEGQGEVSWRLGGWIPLVRDQGRGVTRSAAGRYAGERVFLPAALLPKFGIDWRAKGPNEVQATMDVHGESVVLVFAVAADGALERVDFDRWSDGEQRRFTVLVDEERRFGHYRIPSRFRAVWRAGEREEHYFFEARVLSARHR